MSTSIWLGTGTYLIDVLGLLGPDKGIYTLIVDDVATGQTADFYQATAGRRNGLVLECADCWRRIPQNQDPMYEPKRVIQRIRI